ncbi:MAG: NAD-dependent epimerase/dehydratase family protein, partial [Planctomycetota bacterium]
TCATYGEPEVVPIPDDHPQNPINPYGRTKLHMEHMMRDYSHAYGMRYAALRYFNAAGARGAGGIGEDHAPETHLIPLVLQVALGQREKIMVFGDDYETRDGTCIRDYIHVDDLGDAHLRALRYLQDGKGNLECHLGTGNGFTVSDNTAGGNDFSVTNAGLSFAAENLGIKVNAGTGTTIDGADQSKVRVENMFTHLQELSTALKNNDEAGISLAGSAIEDDIDSVIAARARVGVQARRVEDQLSLTQDRDIQEQTMLSQLQDADLTEVLTRFQQLQLQLQASLQVGSASQELSLLDFLR